MKLADYLAREWQPALGCTEPASIAYAAASAAAQVSGAVKGVHLVCDPRLYKNCYAVGIPHSGHKTGLLWTLAIGCLLGDPGAKLECFNQINEQILAAAGDLIKVGGVTVQVDRERKNLYADCRVIRENGVGRAVIAETHTGLNRLERDGQQVDIASASSVAEEGNENLRADLTKLSFLDYIDIAGSMTGADLDALRRGGVTNLAIANHGLSLFPKSFMGLIGLDQLTRISRLVCAGVYARMCGEDYTVMTLAGSGNKGITVSVPIILWGRECGIAEDLIYRSLALACLVTSATTHRLGTLSAVCGCSNAAGIGLASGLVLLQGGGNEQIRLAVNNMVGNVTGMICDGAKIGCGLKTMTSADAAFRASSLAMAGVGIPYSDGVVGENEAQSMANLERIATQGMRSMDEEILKIMQSKLDTN